LGRLGGELKPTLTWAERPDVPPCSAYVLIEPAHEELRNVSAVPF
jgi:hypothetical protein